MVNDIMHSPFLECKLSICTFIIVFVYCLLDGCIVWMYWMVVLDGWVGWMDWMDGLDGWMDWMDGLDGCVNLSIPQRSVDFLKFVSSSRHIIA